MKKRHKVLVIDDDRALGETLVDELASDDFDVTFVTGGPNALPSLSGDYAAVVTDLRMPGLDGLEVVARSRAVVPERPVIVMTAFSAVDTAIESIRRGAYHYLTKPFQVDELALFLQRAIAEAELRREAAILRRAFHQGAGLENVVGASGALAEVCSLIVRVADASTPVLLLGETGTGKGLFARALHDKSRRASGPFVTVNCAAVPEPLLESELFGHVRGAFTGATTNRVGLMEEANGGTLFLDEIGELPLPLQAKLLHVVETGVVRPVGSNKERTLDLRFVTATHRDLHAAVASGTFREDLLFRLDIATITVPPLRERRGDIPDLVRHFLAAAKQKHPASEVKEVAPATLERLRTYAWPGNVRELANVIERAVLFGTGTVITEVDLPPALREAASLEDARFSGRVRPLDAVIRQYAEWALAELGGRRVATAEALGIDRKTLARILQKGR